jgi:mono/diheme cytochrome c family protein
VRRPNAFDAFANFYFAVLAPGANREAAAMPNIAGAVIVLDGLLFALALWPLGRSGFTPRLAGGIATVVLMAGGMFYATRPISNLNGQANPIAPSAQSIAAGQAVFEARCVVCHGQDGRGDGPLGMTLVPRPADLTIHAVPGVHTDAQLYQWITDGFPGTAMPAWGKALSDTDRWNLVNFIRTFAPKPQ